MSMKVLEVVDLSVLYQDVEVLSRVSFDVMAGDYLGIVGPNGSGKTTLVRCCLGLVEAVSGQIRLFGTERGQFSEWYRIGYVPQAFEGAHRGFPATVGEVVASGLLSRKRFPKRLGRPDGEKVDEVLEILGIQDLKKKMIERLSGGQRQRVFLARALASDPEVLFLDEPTVALDPSTRERFYETLDGFNHRDGKTIVIITHDSGTIGEYASKLLYLDRSVVFFGDFGQFCRSERMTDYFGEHAQHMICHQHKGSCIVG